jgi:hypothetical protein
MLEITANNLCFKDVVGRRLTAELKANRFKLIDLTGKQFRRLRVKAYAQDRKWLCVCNCGALITVDGSHLRRGHTKSCGCLRKQRMTKHGMSRSPEYRSWVSMKQRCFNPRNPAYENYGGRGIIICEEWLCFEAYFADTGTRPPECSLDRIDNDGNYEPGNVRWATRQQQRQNQRRPKARAAVKRRQCEPLVPAIDDPPFVGN